MKPLHSDKTGESGLELNILYKLNRNVYDEPGKPTKTPIAMMTSILMQDCMAKIASDCDIEN